MSSSFKLDFEPHSNCRVGMKISGRLAYEFDSKNGSQIAAKILRASAEAFIQSGKSSPDFTKQWTEWGVAPTTALMLGPGPSQMPDMVSLLLQYGDTVLAVPIEKSRLRLLGEAMVALSAEGEAN